MNEWSPGGNYSSPGTQNLTGRSLRSQHDESEKGAKPLVNIRPVPENRNRTFQQHSMEDVSKTSLSTSNKKGGGNGISDPRFKRVIATGVQNDACVGTEGKNSKALEEKEAPTAKVLVWNGAEFKPNKSWVECVKNSEQFKTKSKSNCEADCENFAAAEDSNFDQSQDHLKAVDKLSFNHDILAKSVSKESLSECTVNTRNTSLVSEEFPDEFSNELLRVPSATRVKKVQNWIHNQTPKPEKKHSVITVIGQMQEPDTLSSALQEIDKRRKLVKELDKYAVCKKIIESDKEKEISDLMIKINTLADSKGVLFSGSNETLNTCSHSTKGCGDKLNKHSDLSNNENTLSHCNDLNTDSTVPLSVSRKRSSIKKKFAKSHSSIESPVRGRFRMLFSSLLYQRLFCILIIMSAVLCWFAIFSVQNGVFLTFDLFNSKPKPITWYERICNWLWELFRPSGVSGRGFKMIPEPFSLTEKLSKDKALAFVLILGEKGEEHASES